MIPIFRNGSPMFVLPLSTCSLCGDPPAMPQIRKELPLLHMLKAHKTTMHPHVALPMLTPKRIKFPSCRRIQLEP